jgi:hypothetical protein
MLATQNDYKEVKEIKEKQIAKKLKEKNGNGNGNGKVKVKFWDAVIAFFENTKWIFFIIVVLLLVVLVLKNVINWNDVATWIKTIFTKGAD